MGVRETGAPSTRHGTPLEVDHEPAEVDDRLRGSIRPAQRCAQTGEELVDAERLRDVVVGARVECGHLLRSSPTADRTRIGASNQPRSSRHTSVPLPSGRTRSRMTPFGRPHRGGRKRRRSRRDGFDLVAGALKAGPQSAQDLRLVVDDEDPHVAHLTTATCSAAAGRSRTNVEPPCSLDGSTRMTPPFASAKPRAIARPRPLPRPSPLPRSNGSKIRSRSAATIPGPRSRTADEHSACARRARRDRDGIGRRRELQRVLQQVHEHTLDLRGVDADRQGGRFLKRDRDTIGLAAELFERPGEHDVDGPHLGTAHGRARIEPREIEQVLDKPLEAMHLDSNRLRQRSRDPRNPASAPGSRGRRLQRGSRSTASEGRG